MYEIINECLETRVILDGLKELVFKSSYLTRDEASDFIDELFYRYCDDTQKIASVYVDMGAAEYVYELNKNYYLYLLYSLQLDENIDEEIVTSLEIAKKYQLAA